MAAKHRLGDGIQVSSDGDWGDEWLSGAWRGTKSGVQLYEHIFPDRAPAKNILEGA